jgi:hypothetical protein
MPRISFSYQYVMSTPIAEGVGRVSRSVECGRNGHVLADPGKGRSWHPIVVDGSDNVPCLSPSGGEVNYYAPLYLECGLTVVQCG